MIGLQITKSEELAKVNKMETCDSADNSKIKITKVLFTPEDLLTYLGDDNVSYPIIPGKIALGQISDASESAYLTKGTRVYINPITNCDKCIECLSGNEEKCSAIKIAGKDTDGFLRDFAVVKNNQLYALPNTVNDNDALLIDHISLALSVIDRLSISKGEHVAVIGGGIIGTILCLLIIYYQGVPILIDSDYDNLERAKRIGIYYNLFSDNKVEKEVSELTGARMAQKVVYVADSNINTDLALKLATHNAKIGFVGFCTPSLRVNFNLAMRKQLEFVCVTNGFGFTEQAINMLANKALDLSAFNIPTVDYANSEAEIKRYSEICKQEHVNNKHVIFDMMK